MSDQPNNMNTPHHADAQNTLRILARRDLQHWRGLVTATTLNDFGAVFGVDRARPISGRLGSDLQQANWYALAAGGFPVGMRVWTIGDQVVLVDAMEIDLPGGLLALMNAIGKPEAKLDSYLGVLEIQGSEWVYCSRGMTLYVNPDNGILLRIAVYASTTLEEYKRDLRLDLKMVRLPVRTGRVQESAS